MPASTLGALATAATLMFAPHSLTLSDGRSVQAEIAYLTTVERRADPLSRAIQVAIIRLKGTGTRSGPPIVFLPGSPDGAAGSQSVSAASLYPFFESLRGSGDILIMDYRGSGLSRPALTCPPSAYRRGMFANRQSAIAAIVGGAQECAAAARRAGFDLNGYTWAEVAEDIAELRRSLGVPQVSIVGFSSGTHAAFAFLRRHEREVSRLVLIGSEGPDQTRKLPSNVDRQLAAIGQLAAEDSSLGAIIPDFPALVRRVVDSLNKNPAVVELSTPAGDKVRESVSGLAVGYLTAKSISGPEEFAMLPSLYIGLSRGNTALLTRLLQRFVGGQGGGGGRQLSYMLDGSSGVSPRREATIAREAETAVLGDIVNFPFPDIRAAWGNVDLGPAFREPIRADTPALFVTGSLDGNTPPAQADEIRQRFRNGGRLVIARGGHVTAFTTPAAWPVITSFLNGTSVGDARVAAAPVRFLPVR